MEVNYIPIEHLHKRYLVEIIEVEKEIIIVIQYQNQNVFNSLALSQRTIESIPSTTTIYGDLFDSESQSISQLLSMKYNKRVLVSGNVEFSSYDDTKNVITSRIVKFLNECHSKQEQQKDGDVSSISN